MNWSNRVMRRRQSLLSAITQAALLFFVLAAFVTVIDALATNDRALYRDLGLTKEASKDDVKRSFRRLTRVNHPDTKDTLEEKEKAKEVMARVLRAYEVLSDDRKRLDYDETGFIPGEAIDPKDHTAKDIFEYYNQKMPIFSKSETIESFATIDRIKHFRGNRLFLIQVYDDACTKCRLYSNPWETLYHSGLVAAGIVKMYRIDAKSVDGPRYMSELGLSYTGSEPTVAVFIDGEKWRLFGIKEALKRQKERMAFEQLLDFVMNFFYESHVETASLHATFMSSILTFLQAPRNVVATRPNAKPPIRVLFPKLNAESVPLALAMRFGDKAVVRSVEREPLIDLVEQYCKLEVNVYDRRGEPVPLPEFVVVSTEALPAGQASTPRDDEDDENMEDEQLDTATKPAGAKKCKGVEIGASAALTYSKAFQFVSSLIPPPHEGMSAAPNQPTLPYLDSMAFAEVCEQNCVMWVRESCAAPTEELALQELQATTAVLSNDFLSFKTGYLCADEQPKVAEYVNKVLPGALGKKGHRGPLLLALMNSDDFTVYFVSSLQAKAPLELSTRDVDAVLSLIVDSKDVPRRKKVFPTEAEIQVVDEGVAFTTLLPYKPFPMSTKQRYSLLAHTLFSFVSPYITNVAPFFFMWLVHTKFLGRRNTGPDLNAAPATAASPAPNGGKTAGGAALPKRFPTGKRKPRALSPDPPRPPNVVADFTKADIVEAREGKGFLLLLLDDRAMNSAALKLPLIMSDPRFTVRMLTSGTSDWNEWVRNQVSAVSGGEAEAAEPAPSLEDEKGLQLVAIRKGRMQCAAKPQSKDIEAFLRDILDGTQAVHTKLPEFTVA